MTTENWYNIAEELAKHDQFEKNRSWYQTGEELTRKDELIRTTERILDEGYELRKAVYTLEEDSRRNFETAEEVADIMYFCKMLSNYLQGNLATHLKEKRRINEVRFPAEEYEQLTFDDF